MSIRIHPSVSAASDTSARPCPRHAALKSFTCGLAALAVTAVFSWSFVHTTSIERLGGALASLSAAADLGRLGR